MIIKGQVCDKDETDWYSQKQFRVDEEGKIKEREYIWEERRTWML